MTYQHVTAPTQFVEANGIRFAYRRFGQEGGTPLLFMRHFRGGMDHWDPSVTDGFANGDNDIMVPTINSFMLSQKIPSAQLVVYPDAGHGSLFQLPELFVSHGRIFLDGPLAATETKGAS
jgi:pimeloyl-ACP methyl ester carboxylesterase